MPAWVEIVLDTAAPEVDLGAVERPSPDRVEVGFTASADTQTLSATLDVYGDGSLPVLVEGAKLIAQGVPDDALLLTLTVSAEDDVGNRSTTTEEFQISLFELGGRLTVGPIMRAYIRVLPYFINKEMRIATAFFAKATINPVMKISGRASKIFRAILKIDQGDR